MRNVIEGLGALCLILVFIFGCSKGKAEPQAPAPETTPKAPAWKDQPRDKDGRWISELTAYAKRENITYVKATAGVEFEQYVYDYSVSHGPKLNAKELHDYEVWKTAQKK